MKSILPIQLALVIIALLGCTKKSSTTEDKSLPDQPTGKSEPLVSHIYTADPSAHVFDNRIYIYPSHDFETGVPENDLGDHFGMIDYHILSMDSINGKITDHGVALTLKDVAWAGRQMWAPDAAFANGIYYLFFPAKDKKDVFRIGVAKSKKPEGPFVAEKEPIAKSYSIDPSVFKDDDGSFYMYFGGIWGGQLQRWDTNEYHAEGALRKKDEPAILPRVAKLNSTMDGFAEDVKEVKLVDANGKGFTEGQNDKRFFEASWVHKFNGHYYFSYSTGDTHLINYAIGDSPYGPFVYKGIVLNPPLNS